MMYNATPRLPKALLHPMIATTRTFERDPERGGQSKPVSQTTANFLGIVLPLTNEDWKQLSEGSYTENSQKLYTDEPITLVPGQIVQDTFDGQTYTVKKELSHNSIHPMLRYVVEGVKKE